LSIGFTPAFRQRAAYRLTIAAGTPIILLAGVAFLYRLDFEAGYGFIPCLFHLTTGLDCIGCGTTRALHALLHGRVGEALSYNLFMMIWLPLPAYAWLGEWLRAVAGHAVIPAIRDTRRLMLALAVSAILFFILRNLPWMPFAWLAA